MTLKWTVLRGTAAIVITTLTAVAVLGCAPEQPRVTTPAEGAAGVQARPAQPMTTPTPRPGIAPAPTPQPGAPVPPAITRALEDVYANVDWFEGIVEVTTDPGAPEESSTSFRHWFRSPDLTRLDVLKSDADEAPVGTVFTYDGQTVTLYNPDENRVLRIEDRAQLALFLNLPQRQVYPQLRIFEVQRFLQDISEDADVEMVGTDTVANRPTEVVEITPKDPTPSFQSAKVWLDEQTRAPLRLQVFRDDDTVLMEIEYSQFDPTKEVPQQAFTFQPPADAEVITPTPDQLPELAGFEARTLQEAQQQADFTLFQPDTLPQNVSEQSVQLGTFDGMSVVAFLYGRSPEDISTTLIQKSEELSIPDLRDAEMVEIDGVMAEVYDDQDMVVIDWVREGTALTLASTLPREEALEIARSVR